MLAKILLTLTAVVGCRRLIGTQSVQDFAPTLASKERRLMESIFTQTVGNSVGSRGRGASAAQAGSPRPNFYATVHKALRACLMETLLAAGRADPQDDSDLAQLVARVHSLCMFYRLHAAKEDQFIHPAMEARSPGSSIRTANDHVQHAKALALLEEDSDALKNASGSARDVATQALYRDLALFAADDLVHMHAEEVDNNAVLWACYSDAELAQIEYDLVSSIPPAQKITFMPWMVAACSPAERTTLLAAVRASAPVAAFDALLASIKARLTDVEWGKLSLALAA
jgi:hypothetical protein